MELISVIVPVYNVAGYLSRCLESIAAQTYSSLEVLVVDDGSTDGSGEICDDFARRDVRFRVFHQENRGLSAARNVALSRFRGEYACFVDGDDFLDPEMIARLHARVREGYDLAMTGFRREAEGGRQGRGPAAVQGTAPLVLPGRECVKELLGGRLHYEMGFVWNKIYSRRLLEGIWFYDIYSMEDAPFNLRVFLRAKNMIYDPEPLYHYVSRPGSILQSYPPRYFHARLTGYDRMLGDIPAGETALRGLMLQKIFNPQVLSWVDGLKGTQYGRASKALARELLRRHGREYLGMRTIPFRERIANLVFWTVPVVRKLVGEGR